MMAGISILFVLILVITTAARFLYFKKTSKNIAEERISNTDKIVCMILAGPFPLAVLLFAALFMPNIDPEPMTLTFAIFGIEAFALVSAFRLIRLAHTPVWIIGLVTFPFHVLFFGFMFKMSIISWLKF
ncbi:MAG: hypothetical protein PHW60_06130 [Kiritimatiellae bacterium]|nr:hypothetical protein [Kiritimatiellia bacterium]